MKLNSTLLCPMNGSTPYAMRKRRKTKETALKLRGRICGSKSVTESAANKMHCKSVADATTPSVVVRHVS